jgi:hypothetical protein
MVHERHPLLGKIFETDFVKIRYTEKIFEMDRENPGFWRK